MSFSLLEGLVVVFIIFALFSGKDIALMASKVLGFVQKIKDELEFVKSDFINKFEIEEEKIKDITHTLPEFETKEEEADK